MAVSDYPLTETPENCDCSCPDPLAHAVAALVADGMDQRAASLLIYSDRERLSASITARFMAWFPDLKLPGVGSL